MEDNEAGTGKAAKFPCILCKKNVTRKSGGVQCSTCKLWAHTTCGKISKELFAILSNPDKHGNVHWNCDSCQSSSARLEAMMSAVVGRITEVENRVIRSEAEIMENRRRVEKVEKDQSDMKKEAEAARAKFKIGRAHV